MVSFYDRLLTICGSAERQGWLDDVAESLKSIDPNHLVTYDSEGFLGSSTPGAPRLPTSPPFPGSLPRPRKCHMLTG